MILETYNYKFNLKNTNLACRFIKMYKLHKISNWHFDPNIHKTHLQKTKHCIKFHVEACLHEHKFKYRRSRFSCSQVTCPSITCDNVHIFCTSSIGSRPCILPFFSFFPHFVVSFFSLNHGFGCPNDPSFFFPLFHFSRHDLLLFWALVYTPNSASKPIVTRILCPKLINLL